ncbi:hypothetical protein GYMLUDRAFT_251313 [Collybiopsis luxurians FD-317 M1]|uniref:Uncharacterized protein n=1 Tax=Collybiopsis luxurians FD-317 M1 TaxID=944289 RepID=A0A0D0C3I2_9AGAR|nr:hypothetical protein GYMLUDRAFT_251313 [Collybiopsis luxurians FD-317 M1]
MAFRAYVHQDDVSVDSSIQITTEELSALGLEVVTFNDSEDPEQAARKLLQGWGYPLDKEDCVVPFDFRHDADNSSEISKFVDQLVQLTHKPELAFPCELAGLVTDSGIYFDVEDVKAQRWIRIHPGPNQLYRIHPGVKVRIIMLDHNRHHHGTLFFKDGVSSLGIIPGTDLHDHEARRGFLARIGHL